MLLNTGLRVKFLGVRILREEETINYLRQYVRTKEIILDFDRNSVLDNNTVEAYVYLKNRIFINAYLIKAGLAEADRSKDYKNKAKFIELERKAC